MYEVYPKKKETFTIEQKLMKVRKKNTFDYFFDVVASYLYALAMALHLPQEGRSIVLTDQRPGDPALLFLEGIRTHGLDCQRCLHSRKHKKIVRRVDDPAS